MLTKLFSALLLTVGAMAVPDVDSNCISLWEDVGYKGTKATLCYLSRDKPAYFELDDFSIESVGSYIAGSKTEFGFCEKDGSSWSCY